MHKLGKKLLSLALIGTVSLSLCGCSSSSKENNEVITLKILENDTAKKQGYFQVLLDAFNAAYKDKGIQAIDANIDEYTDLAKNGPHGYGPDVIYQANDKLMAFADDKHIRPIDREAFDCFSCTSEAAWDAFKIIKDGKTNYCAVPVNVQEPMLFYRADNLPQNWENDWDDDKNGKPDFFENWNDLYAYSLYLREHDTSSAKDSTYGYVAPLKDVYFSSGFLFSYGGYVFNTTENGDYDTQDIGFSKGNAELGTNVIRQLASVMNEGCIDDSVKSDRYEKVANKTYFCAISTPDTYSLFYDKLENQYKEEGLSADEAAKAAKENLMMIDMPKKLPADGDLTKDSSAISEDGWVDAIYMGGVSGYGISSYTKNYDASVEFVKFATSYEMVAKRADILGIAATREDVAQKGKVTESIYNNLRDGFIYLMPSCSEVSQIWKPGETLLSDLAKDPFRKANGEPCKYETLESMKAGLETVDENIYKAIFTLANEETKTEASETGK